MKTKNGHQCAQYLWKASFFYILPFLENLYIYFSTFIDMNEENSKSAMCSQGSTQRLVWMVSICSSIDHSVRCMEDVYNDLKENKFINF